MDGVLADWNGGFERKFPGLTYDEFNVMPTDERESYRIQVDADPTFYRNLEPIQSGINILNSVNSFKESGEYRVEILTAVGEDYPESLIQQKRDWVAQHLGYEIDMNFVTHSEEKANYAVGDTSILIDDREKSINPFVDAGGIGILWDGLKSSEEELRESLEVIIQRLFNLSILKKLEFTLD